MSEIIEAIYEKGVFKPLQNLELPEGQHVRLVVEAAEPSSSTDILALAAQVYEGLSPEDIDAIEQIARNRGDFFGEGLS